MNAATINVLYRRAVAAWLAAGLWFGPAAALAHSVEMTAGRAETAWVQAFYSDGEPMAYAKMHVLDAAGRTLQVGNADGRGRFAWFAEGAGPWRVLCEDGLGHRAEIAADDPEIQAPQPAPPAGPSRQNRGSRAALGLSLIFFIFGAFFWWKGRRKGTFCFTPNN